MKRKKNLYEDIYKLENIFNAFNEICKNTKNKRKVRNYKEYKCIYVTRVYNTLKNRNYVVGPYNVFTIYEPKERRIVIQNMHDKIINHLVSRYILYPSLMPCLINANVASRKGMGTKRGLELAKEFHRICKIKYNNYYILKCDISKFFASIDHDVLKEKLKRKIKDKEALNIVFSIIDSDGNGLSIGNMTHTNITSFRKDIYNLLEQTIKYNEPINITTKNGNAIVLSEEDYNNIMETLYISSIPNLKDELIKRSSDTNSNYMDESEVDW